MSLPRNTLAAGSAVLSGVILGAIWLCPVVGQVIASVVVVGTVWALVAGTWGIR